MDIGEKMNNEEIDIDTVDLEDVIQKDKKEKRHDIGKSKGWKTILAIIILSVIVVSISQYILLSEKEIGYANYNNTAKNDTRNKDTVINMTEEDKIFKSWVYISYVPIIEDLKCVTKAAKSQSFNDTEICGRFLKDNANRIMEQIERYNVSISMKDVQKEYKKSLEYYNIGGSNLELGARERNFQQMNDANAYIQNGTNNMDRVLNLLENYGDKQFAD